MDTQNRFSKIAADGAVLPREATKWEAVLDNKTGLMWSLETKKAANWKAAQKVPGKIKAAGFTDWRMPTVEELFLLADRTKCDPAIDADFFPDTPSDWFWTSTVDCESPGDYAWLVSFGSGGSGRERPERWRLRSRCARRSVIGNLVLKSKRDKICNH
jgi:hypothetical protein